LESLIAGPLDGRWLPMGSGSVSPFARKDLAVVLKDVLRPLPGFRQVSLLRQRLGFQGSASFWERRYVRGGWSGPGSYGDLASGKAKFLNDFVRERDIDSVIEFGCGDGNQLSLASYPHYVGLDVSKSAIELCIHRFADDRAKSFFLYGGSAFVDRDGLFSARLALSLDVIYHLTENSIFESYMSHLFAAGLQYVIIYSTNAELRDDAPHVTHRKFSSWVDDYSTEWRLDSVTKGPGTGPRAADFYVFERLGYSAGESLVDANRSL
jgi:SAM-dependent methyltransferase